MHRSELLSLPVPIKAEKQSCRAFGQAHYLATLGLCIPGSESALYLFDNILTHFGREEDMSTLNGKLQDDLVRLHELLEKLQTVV